MDLRWSLLGLAAFALFVKITRSKDRPASPNNKNNMDLGKPQVGASSSSSSSSSSTHSFTHDVFLSFRGPDTRNNFTGHLHSHLVNNGFETFIDDGLPKGEDIWQELVEVIGRSKISIVVFSAKYAFSKWCLNELVKIIECKESKQQIVCPIFYKVDPSQIRYQTGQVADGIAHLSQYDENLEKVESWKAALRTFATLSGWPISDGGHEANVIEQIIKEISTKITRSTLLRVAECPVAIESRVKDIVELLNVGQANPHMVGIWGIGGIGKSTLANAIYNLISHEFQHSCFLSIVGGASFSDGGLDKLQTNFLKSIERDSPKVINVAQGITLLKQKLRQKKVLLVLDNVNHLDQLTALAGGCDWFGPRSRIIITTRDLDFLNAHGVDFDSIYEVKGLDHQDASKLFNLHAFKRDICPEDYFELATEVIHYAKGLPLVLEVLGSNLRSKNKGEWKDALEYYRRCPHKDIQKILQRSYDGLDDQIQQVFLHIACFFKGDKQSYVLNVLQSRDLNPRHALNVLKEKALIKIEKDNSIWMHDLIEGMGKEIVRKESPDETEQRSRLWLYEDVRKILEENKGTDKIKGIVLRTSGSYDSMIQLNSGSFTNLKNLQIFIVCNEILRGESDDEDWEVDVDYLPNTLRGIHWRDCSLRSLPKNFNPRELVMLHMRGRCMTPLVNKGLKSMLYLKSIKLSFCHGLTRIPDLSGLTSLEYLKLSWCEDLVEVDPSVGRLDKLITLKFTHCWNLQMFPKRINLKSLETLDLSSCPLKLFPEIEGDMKSLNHLYLGRTAIKELPCSVGNLTGLKSLFLSESAIRELPCSVGNLTGLKSLSLSDRAIKELPCSLGNLTGLKSLSLNWCSNLTNVPSSIFYGMQCLEDLALRHCHGLVTFPTKSESLPPPVFSTKSETRLQVFLYGCYRLEEISEFPLEIDVLSVEYCKSLKRISKLSKILEGKDSKMFVRLDLYGCPRLCDNLALALARGVVSEVEADKQLFHLAKKRKMTSSPFAGTKELVEKAEKLTSLLTLFFSFAKSEEFQVKFSTRSEEEFQASPPTPIWWNWRQDAIPIPNWFTWRQDVNFDMNSEEKKQEHEYCIEIPQNSNWDYKGLAFCVQLCFIQFVIVPHFVYINGIKFIENHMHAEDKVWVHYIPFVTLRRRLSECGMDDDNFRVMFRFEYIRTEGDRPSGGSCGVHLIKDLEGECR